MAVYDGIPEGARSSDLPTMSEKMLLTTDEVIEVGQLLRDLISRDVQIEISSAWGLTQFNHGDSTTNGATIANDGSEIKLSTGTNGSATATLRSLDRGEYRAGGRGEAGIGIRIPSAPTGSQQILMGYEDGENGIGWGYDATGIFVYRRTDGTIDYQKYQDAWNRDPLDGSGVRARSGLTLNLAHGTVLRMDYNWYGHGSVRWRALIKDETEGFAAYVLAHEAVWTEEFNFEDPNQPLRVYVENGGTASNFDVYVSDMQYSLLGAGAERATRDIPVTISDYTITAAQTVWEPILAVRKKENFNSKPNSIRCTISNIAALADNQIEARLTVDAVTTGETWANPDTWTDAETPVERKRNTGSLGTSQTGLRVISLAASGSRSGIASVDEQTRIVLSEDVNNQIEFVLWVRAMSASTTVVEYAEIHIQADF